MNTQNLVEKTHEKFCSTWSYLEQTQTDLKQNLRSRLLGLDSLLRELYKQETDEKRKMYIFYALMYVDSALDNLDYMNPEHDPFAVWQTKWAVKKAFEIFTDLYKDK